jgi:hypothetical protein
MEDVVREPVVLIDEDLDEVAGGKGRTVNVGVGAVFGGENNNNVGIGQNNGLVSFGNIFDF